MIEKTELFCYKCGSNNNIIHHHKSYNPEVIVTICRSCHKKLHNNLRSKGKCNVPADVLRITSINSEHAKQSRRNYCNNNREKINFYTTMDKNVRMHDILTYNIKTGNVKYLSMFESHNNKELIEISKGEN